jgi:pteridine reductase
MQQRTVLVTGAARRIGAAIVRCLHEDGANVAIHCNHSVADAERLKEELNVLRSDSAEVFTADLTEYAALAPLIDKVVGWAGQLDCLVNNASGFYATPLGDITENEWHDLVGSNLKAPLFLSQAAWPHLRRRHGSIVNLVDIHAQRPMRQHVVYGTAKAGLAMLTRSLAKEMAPEVRVNGVAPGAILWPEDSLSETARNSILRQIPLGRPGDPRDIASCVLYLVRDAIYVTGQVIAIDGGRSIGW